MAFASRLRALFSHNEADEEFFEELTDTLIEGDISSSIAVKMTDMLSRKNADRGSIKDELLKMIGESVRGVELTPSAGKINVWMVLGVNGVGKTTTCAKIASMFRARGISPIVLAAADTFRAAAIEQLIMHGEALSLRVVHHQMGSDPSAVVYDACEAVKAGGGGGLVIVDTAGRLHNKEGLVRELQKINKTCIAKSGNGECKKLLVLDATTGQNAVRQAEVFNEAVGVDAIVLAKSDATSKGGALVTIGRTLNIPVAFTGYGEKYSDIKVFNKDSFVRAFIGED